ncbi:MAG: hypothetical protein NT062_33505 [Proteobacteria bacterium]|nr:hypothetical protein [Pseudomonadota bacterium]
MKGLAVLVALVAAFGARIESAAAGECQTFRRLAGTTDAHQVASQLLSFASCMQDASVERVTDPDELPAMVGRLTARLAPVMPAYVRVLERGPDQLQVRAAYFIGMAYVNLMVRARSAIIRPANVVVDEVAAARDRELHVRLERLLFTPARIARLSFAVIDHAVTADPRLAADPVTAHMVQTAHALGVLLQRDWSDDPFPDRHLPLAKQLLHGDPP